MKRRSIILGTVGLSLLVAVVWFVALWQPQGRAIDAAAEREQAAEELNARLQSRLEALRSTEERLPVLQTRLEHLRAAVPEEPRLGEFVLDANDAAERSGIDFLAIAPAEPASDGEGGDSLRSIQMSVQVDGGYFQVLDFLNRLTEMPRIVVIESVKVTANSGDATGRLSVTLTARMFTSTTPESGGDGGDAAPEEPVGVGDESPVEAAPAAASNEEAGS